MIKLQKFIEKAKKSELTTNDMAEMSLNRFDVKLDRDLDIKDVWKTLQTKATIVLLLKGQENEGHYISITIDEKRKVISFFDPYGFHPNILSNISGEEITNFLFQVQTALPFHKLEINLRKIQKLDNSTSTCGRWCLMRCFLKNLSNQEFNQLFDEPLILKNPDDIITALTVWHDMITM